MMPCPTLIANVGRLAAGGIGLGLVYVPPCAAAVGDVAPRHAHIRPTTAELAVPRPTAQLDIPPASIPSIARPQPQSAWHPRCRHRTPAAVYPRSPGKRPPTSRPHQRPHIHRLLRRLLPYYPRPRRRHQGRDENRLFPPGRKQRSHQGDENHTYADHDGQCAVDVSAEQPHIPRCGFSSSVDSTPSSEQHIPPQCSQW